MTPQRVLALVFVTGILLIAADFESTSELAQALAVLIMISVLVMYGPDAIKNVQGLVAPEQPTGRSRGGAF